MTVLTHNCLMVEWDLPKQRPECHLSTTGLRPPPSLSLKVPHLTCAPCRCVLRCASPEQPLLPDAVPALRRLPGHPLALPAQTGTGRGHAAGRGRSPVPAVHLHRQVHSANHNAPFSTISMTFQNKGTTQTPPPSHPHPRPQ